MNNKANENSINFLRGAFILTIAAVITKALSAGYRIPFQNIAGDIGFYIYQQVYPFYAIALIFSTYGFPVVLSKWIAERQDQISIRTLLLYTFFVLSLFGTMLFILLYGGAGWLARLMNDPKLEPLIKLTSFSFLFMPFISVMRGYYQGKGNMVPTAVSQVGEQFVRVLCILVFSYVLFLKGYSLYDVGAGAVLGSIAGGIISILILLTFFWIRNEWDVLRKQQPNQKNVSLYLVGKVILLQGFAFCITSLVLVLIQLIDSLQLFPLLVSSGFNEHEAKEWKGVFDRGQPLIQLGTVVTTSLSLTLVPLISKNKLENNRKELIENSQLSFRISLMIGTAASIGLISIIKPTNIMLFTDDKGSLALSILAGSIFFSSILMTAAAILQALGYSFIPISIILSGLVIKALFMFVLVPSFDIVGSAYSTLGAFIWMTVCFIVILRKQLKAPIFRFRSVMLVLAGAAAMTGVLSIHTFIFEELLIKEQTRILAFLQAISGVGIGAVCYIWIVIRFGLFSSEELAMLPLGSKLSKLLPKKISRSFGE
jgi:O-antigen/teichoic acid export membrane protein